MQKKAAEVINNIKRKAVKATERTLDKEPIGNGLFFSGVLSGGDECVEIIERTYAEKWDFFNTLSAIQRTWVKQYIDGAVCDYFYCDSRDYPRWRLKDLCPILIAVVDAIDSGALPFNFRESELLGWAVDAGFMLTKDGLAVWKDIQSADTSTETDTSPAASDKGAAKADTKAKKPLSIHKSPMEYFVEQAKKEMPEFDSFMQSVKQELENEIQKQQKNNRASQTADASKDMANAGSDDRGYKVLKPGAVKLRVMLYGARQKEIDRCNKKYGAAKGKYHAEKWETWIPKFKKRKAVQNLLHEKFNLKSGKGYIQVAASEFDVKRWKFIYYQEREERQ